MELQVLNGIIAEKEQPTKVKNPVGCIINNRPCYP